MRWVLRVGAALVVVAAAVVAVVWWRAGRDSTPVAADSAVARFRASPGREGDGTPPAPGVYTYATHGRECAGVSTLRICRDLPGTARMIITRPGGQVLALLELSQEHQEASRWAIRPDGRYLLWQRSSVSFAGFGGTDAKDTVPATLAIPARPGVGRRWTQRFRFGNLRVSCRNVIVRRGDVRVGDRDLPAVLIRSTSVTTGDHPGTEVDLTWHIPSLGLDARSEVHRRVGGTFPYRMDAWGTLVSVEPAT